MSKCNINAINIAVYSSVSAILRLRFAKNPS